VGQAVPPAPGRACPAPTPSSEPPCPNFRKAWPRSPSRIRCKGSGA
jgi:hypothetical protein